MKEKLNTIIELLTALRDGKKLQWKYQGSEWIDIDTVDHLCSNEFLSNVERYRIKPEPREWWHVILDEKELVGAYEDFETAKFAFDNGYTQSEKQRRRIIHVKEVL